MLASRGFAPAGRLGTLAAPKVSPWPVHFPARVRLALLSRLT